MSVKILLLEDDNLFNETLQDFLEEEGFVIESTLDPYSALDLTYRNNYDLYLFDVNLPYESGFEFLKKLRESGDLTPTVFLTSRDDKESLVEGFVSGADDYMKKPIDLDELALRIEALMRRQARTKQLKIGDYTLDVLTKKVYLKEVEIDLSNKAVDLLLLLINAQSDVVNSEMIKERLWSAGQTPSEGAIRVYITQLKKYFPRNIVNIRGIGYKWEM